MPVYYRTTYVRQRRNLWIPTATSAAPVTVTPDVAALVLTQQTPTVAFTDDKAVAPGVASLTLTGLAPTVLAPSTVTPAAASLVLTGQAPTVAITADLTVTPAAASLTLTGLAPIASLAATQTPGAASLVLTGFAPTVVAPSTVSPAAASLILTGLAPVVLAPSTVAPATASLVLTGAAPTVVLGGDSFTFEAGIGKWAAQGSATVSYLVPGDAHGGVGVMQVVTDGVAGDEGANLGETQDESLPVDPSTSYRFTLWARGSGSIHLNANRYNGGSYLGTSVGGNFTLTGSWQQIELVFTSDATATDVDLFVLTNGTQAVTFEVDDAGIAEAGSATVSPAPGALVLTQQTPTVAFTDDKAVTPAVASLTLTGLAPTVLAPSTVTPGAASLVLTGQAPTVDAPVTVAPAAAALALTGYAPSITTAGASTSVEPATASLLLTAFTPTVIVPLVVLRVLPGGRARTSQMPSGSGRVRY